MDIQLKKEVDEAVANIKEYMQKGTAEMVSKEEFQLKAGEWIKTISDANVSILELKKKNDEYSLKQAELEKQLKSMEYRSGDKGFANKEEFIEARKKYAQKMGEALTGSAPVKFFLANKNDKSERLQFAGNTSVISENAALGGAELLMDVESEIVKTGANNIERIAGVQLVDSKEFRIPLTKEPQEAEFLSENEEAKVNKVLTAQTNGTLKRVQYRLQMSKGLAKFSGYDILSIYQKYAEGGIIKGFGKSYIRGNGVKGGMGLTTTPSVVNKAVSGETTQKLSIYDVFQAAAELDTYYNGAIFGNKKTFIDLLFRKTTEGQTVTIPSLPAQQNAITYPSLMGYAMIEVSEMDTYTAYSSQGSTYASGSIPIFVADLREAIEIVKADAMEVIIDPLGQAAKNMDEMNFIQYGDHVIKKDEAIMLLKVK